MLRIRNLESGYGRLRVLKGVSMHVQEGEIVSIIGANGAGKTTLLKTIAGIIKPLSGEMLFNDKDISGMPAEKIARLGCSLVPEGRQLFDTMTVEENMILGSLASRKGMKRGGVSGRMEKIFDIFPVLKERRNQLAGTLSGGEQQMLAIGRSLMSEPTLIMLDEPSMGLAPIIVKNIFKVIKLLRESGNTILLVEQNARSALAISDRGYVLETGQIMLEEKSQELLNNNDVRRAYLGKDYKSITEGVSRDI